MVRLIDSFNFNDLATQISPLDDPLDKILLRVGITYGVLMRLGFTEDRVLECLKASQSFELDEAFDWVRIFLSLTI